MNLEPYIYEFSALALAHFLALLSPGPDFFIIIRNSIRYSFLSGVFTSLGIAIANGIYIILALLGTSFIKSHEIFFLFAKTSGAIFLLYLGYNLLRAKPQDLYNQKDCKRSRTTLIKSFQIGFLSAFLNPKNYIAYFSFYTVIVSEATPLLIQSIYGLWMFLVVLLWDIFIAFSVGNKRVKNYLNQHTYKIEKISGIVILLIGLFILKESLFG